GGGGGGRASSGGDAFGSRPTHSVMARLALMACGPGGGGGIAPAAIRSVQSANMASARLAPSWLTVPIIWPPACPDCSRRSHAATEDGNDPKAAGISRVPLLPS